MNSKEKSVEESETLQVGGVIWKPLRQGDKINLGDSHFLSATNPIATIDQRDMEGLALKMLQMPIIIQAKEAAARRWRMLCTSDVPAEAWVCFDEKMEEFAFHYTLYAINADSNYPKVLSSVFGPPHEWFGMNVPGCRGPGTAENPDNSYSLIPVDGRARFEIQGKLSENPVGTCPFHIVGNLAVGMTLAQLDWRDMDINADGTFVITVGPEPANGRRNHMQSMINARYVFVRASRKDWRQNPHALRVRRVDPPTAPPLTIEQLAALAAKFIVDDVSEDFWYYRMVACVDVNTVTPPETTSFFGGMAIQKLARSRLRLHENEAFVLTLQPGGSEYWVLVMHDHWLMSVNFWSRLTTLNTTQSVPNADGTYTYVLSLRDPGVHNWIDMYDAHEPLFMIRWNELPRTPDPSRELPGVKYQLVKLSDLERLLPAETKWVTAQERKQQLAKRLAEFDHRYTV
jgi:Protein of unknown function (DUF1214)